MRYLLLTTALLATTILGCGDVDAPEVRGKVTLDAMPLADAKVLFEPEDPTRPGASVRTAADGTFEIMPHETTGETLPPGKYVVVVSKKVGTTDNAPVEIEDDLEQLEAAGMVRETLPPRYSRRDQTTLAAEVKPEQNDLTFDLQSK